MVLKKEGTLFERDEKGDLIAKEVELVIDEKDERQLEFKGQTVCVIPMMRGEIKKMFEGVKEKEGDEDFDGNLIIKYCINPVYTLEEIKYSKPGLAPAIINTIFSESGLEIAGKNKKKVVDDAEDEFGKN